jgi:hypothetical protein
MSQQSIVFSPTITSVAMEMYKRPGTMMEKDTAQQTSHALLTSPGNTLPHGFPPYLTQRMRRSVKGWGDVEE